MFRLLLTIYLFGLFFPFIHSQPPWANPRKAHWPEQVERVMIRSSADQSYQKAYFFATKSRELQPLLVSLHSWSGDVEQKDRLLPEVLGNDWNYIHPDFRGPNVRPEACGSSLTISDIEDAIRFAIKHGNVDPEEIHIIGSSGGGHETLMMYMRTELNIKTFSAWVPISNLEDWYWSSYSRELKYAGHILAATNSPDSVLDVAEARRRSPFFQPTPPANRKNSQLYIFCGIHDGYSGSVPISHSVHFYNKMVQELGGEKEEMISDKILLYLLAQRSNLANLTKPYSYLDDRLIHLQKKFRNLHLTIFEGGHEMLAPVALDHITKK